MTPWKKESMKVLKMRIASNNSLFQKVFETAVYTLELPQLETEEFTENMLFDAQKGILELPGHRDKHKIVPYF